jgi:hypothetical protein
MGPKNSFSLDLAAAYACDRLGLEDYRNAKKDDLRAQLSKAYALTLDAYRELFFESDDSLPYQEQNPAGGIKSSMMQACERVDAGKHTAVTFKAWLLSGQSTIDKQTFEREELDRWMDENRILECYSVREDPNMKPELQAVRKESKPLPDWLVITKDYISGVMESGQFSTVKELFRELERKAGPDSPFEKGTGHNRGRLYVRDIAVTVSLKTLQNNWTLNRSRSE